MKQVDSPRHPGVMRFMPADSELAGFIVAIGFIVMGIVGIPIAKWFLLGAILIGAGVALLLRILHKRPQKLQTLNDPPTIPNSSRS